MTGPLQILALEPFYSGSRRLMLETLQRRSRHHWTLLKLPGRRIERRLEAAAQWFAEVILRRPPMQFDLLFTSEAINLPELFAACPELSGHPTVVYFHENQLPVPGCGMERPVDHVNLLTANDATENWFNTLYHLRQFSGRAAALARWAPHLFPPGVLERVTARSVLVTPPVELEAVSDIERSAGLRRDRAAIFVDLRRADVELLTAGLDVLKRRGASFTVVAIGSRNSLPERFAVSYIHDQDEDGATFAMARCGVYLSADTDCPFDPRAVMALASGMRAALPNAGAYPEIVPSSAHDATLYNPHPDFLASLVQDLWALPELTGWYEDLRAGVRHYDAESAVSTIDWRLATVVEQYRTAMRPPA
ncbi:MAG: DUF3524 domain-containing protein [Tepidisphaerales bacterium]